jgi:hypothetical protein
MTASAPDDVSMGGARLTFRSALDVPECRIASYKNGPDRKAKLPRMQERNVVGVEFSGETKMSMHL